MMYGVIFIVLILGVFAFLQFYNPHNQELIMAKGKLERRYKLMHNGRQLSQGLLSEAGKYDAFQILVKRFDMGIEDAIDPDEVEVIDMKGKETE